MKPPRPPPVASLAFLLLVTAIVIGLVRPTIPAEPETIAGIAAVIDGDTIRMGETVIRLFDIDAPELAQTCDGRTVALAPLWRPRRRRAG